ncbi:MAG: 2-phosphosulfolactate phosphatase [Streptosporangiaceae bacterium]
MPELADHRPQWQPGYDVRLEWGLQGGLAISQGADIAVIVDVLSFTTAVSVAVDRGAEVFPYRWQDPSAREFARRHDAVLAVGRSAAAAAGTDAVSLSPVSIRDAARLARLVLPSPNGSALAADLAAAGVTVVAACLRNRAAVARWLAGQRTLAGTAPVIAVIAAGERWPDGSLRPAVEDLWGAGALIAALAACSPTLPAGSHLAVSPEARAAAGAFNAAQADLPAALLACASGRELAGLGFAEDVWIAGELDASTSVPLLAGGRFADARHARPGG